jgi:hypothetical protein
MKILVPLLISLGLSLSACHQPSSSPSLMKSAELANAPGFYSAGANEYKVHFRARTATMFRSLFQLSFMTDDQKSYWANLEIKPSLTYLFGPMTHRELGGMKPEQTVVVDWTTAALNMDGFVEVSYDYTGTWILHDELQDSFQIPLPFSTKKLLTPDWKKCTDSDPAEQTESFFWYFWDPARPGCDHVEGIHYQTITVEMSSPTPNEKLSRPEYKNLLNVAGKANNLSMTFAFGYVEEVANPNPSKDKDIGMVEYRKFLRMVRDLDSELNWTETAILDKDYLAGTRTGNQIGVQFDGTKGDVHITLKAVTNAGVDQMDLFAKSYAHDHDGYFGWFGHSRVGSGFDADQFRLKVQFNPSYYSVIKDYQLIYWSGCNSYSYYTMPFFKYKADLNPQEDPNGTKGLDILADGLPTYFVLNSGNAQIMMDALINWEKKTTYQSIVDQLEARAEDFGVKVLVNILGDEDNQ